MATDDQANTLAYAKRMNRVIDFIGAHLEEELSVEQLARVAGSSRFHFQRQFTAYVGTSVAKLTRLMRLKRASYQLAFDPDYRIIQVAMDASFRSPEAFARAFKNTYGQTPTEFRTCPSWHSWALKHQHRITTEDRLMNVEIIEFRPTAVAVLEHRGSPLNLPASVARFIEWRKASQLSPIGSSQTYGVPYSDPEQTPPEEWRFDICGSLELNEPTKGEVPDNPQGVIRKDIPGGRCAVTEHHGSTDRINDTILPLYSQWLPNSGESLRDYPCFFQYVRRMPTYSEHDQLTLVYLPLC